MSGDRASRPGWLPDELVYIGRENLDAEHVARYDEKEHSDGPAEVALLRERGLDRDSLVVEIGPGTGQFTVAVAPVCRRVIAVDVSDLMLAQLQAKVADRGLDNVEIAHAGFLSYEHAGEPADLVYSRYALHHLPDFWKAVALSRIRRMLRPGGLFRLWDVIYDFEPAAAAERLEAWCATGSDSLEVEWAREELEEHVRDEHSTFTWLLEPMLARTGFEVLDAEHLPGGVFSKYLMRAV